MHQPPSPARDCSAARADCCGERGRALTSAEADGKSAVGFSELAVEAPGRTPGLPGQYTRVLAALTAPDLAGTRALHVPFEHGEGGVTWELSSLDFFCRAAV